MSLPIDLSYPAMEAEPVHNVPQGPQWHYEPKWDGFRCLAFRDGEKIVLQSKAQKPLTRYFPELVAALKSLKASSFVLDGEVVVPVAGKLSFDDLLMRIHPAASRVQKLSLEHPCVFIAFDLLVDESSCSLVEMPLHERRKRLEKFVKTFGTARGMLRLSPCTTELKKAARWFHMGTGLDGVVAKREDLPYESGNRSGMKKIKRQRTADCVVGGFRYLEKKPLVGSLLLGLFNDQGLLDHVGFTSSIRNDDRPALTRQCEALIQPPGFTGKSPGGPSRWNTNRASEWQPLRNELVVEVVFDHFTGGRFRHGTKFLRWRPEKSPRACTMEQVERESDSAIDLL